MGPWPSCAGAAEAIKRNVITAKNHKEPARGTEKRELYDGLLISR